jgi:FkbM family methyltransferase
MIASGNSTGRPAFVMVRGHHILAAPLGSGVQVLDLGANKGEFAREMHRRFGCRPLLVEANPRLYQALAAAAVFPVKHGAVAAQSGSLTVNIAKNDEGSSILDLPEASIYGCERESSVTVPAITLPEVYEAFGICSLDLLKVDIEGAEEEVLATCPEFILRSTAQITVEFHCDPSFGFGNRDRVMAVMDRLRRLGFTQYTFSKNFTDVLFVNHSLLGTDPLSRAFLGLRAKPPAWLSALWALVPSALKGEFRRLLGTTKE